MTYKKIISMPVKTCNRIWGQAGLDHANQASMKEMMHIFLNRVTGKVLSYWVGICDSQHELPNHKYNIYLRMPEGHSLLSSPVQIRLMKKVWFNVLWSFIYVDCSYEFLQVPISYYIHQQMQFAIQRVSHWVTIKFIHLSMKSGLWDHNNSLILLFGKNI